MAKEDKPRYYTTDVFGIKKDITDVPVLTALTLSNSPVRLEIDVSNAKGFISDKEYELSTSGNSIVWNLGDGAYKTGNSIIHNYKWPGKYRIKLSVMNHDGTVVSYSGTRTPTVIVKNWLPDKIGWYYPTSAFPANMEGNSVVTEAGRTTSSLWVLKTNSWQSYSSINADGYSIDLYAGGSRLDSDGNVTDRGRSRSVPLVTAQYDTNKYVQFQKTWRFTTDAIGLNPVDKVTTTDTKIYVKQDVDQTSSLSGTFYECSAEDTGATFAGTSGYSVVYYTDDTANESAVGIVASFNTNGWPEYISTRYTDGSWLGSIDQSKYTDLKINHQEAPAARVGVKVASNTPKKLIVTSNGIGSSVFYISKNKFQHTEIPFFISVADNRGSIIKDFPGSGVSTALNGVSAVEFLPGTEPSVYAENTVYFGLCSDAATMTTLADNVTLTNNSALTAVDSLGSYGGSLNVSVTANNVTIVGKLSTNSGVISGASAPFTILPVDGNYNMLKVNEHYDFAGTLKSYILQETINGKEKVTNGLFQETFGGEKDLPETLGKVIYEKIANFTKNTIDVDTCNINSLYSLAKEVGLELENYNLSFPGGIKRIMDILSINHKRLFGSRDNNDLDFDKSGIPDTPGELAAHGRNRKDDGSDSSELSTDTYMVSAGVPIVIKEAFQSRYFKVVPMVVPLSAGYSGVYTSLGSTGLSSYPLSAYNKVWGWGLEWPTSGKFSDYYKFFEYIPNSIYPLSSFDQVEGLIAWNNTQNLLEPNYSVLQETLSSYTKWTEQDGIMDTIIEHKLRKGLGTFTNTG